MRRGTVQVWPALTDLMLVIGVVSLLTAVSLVPLAEDGQRYQALAADNPDLRDELARTHAEIAAQKLRIAELEQALAAAREASTNLQARLREVRARNQAMEEAIGVAEAMMARVYERFEQADGVQRGADQSIRFGEDLVTFAKDDDVPVWGNNGRRRLADFCGALAAAAGDLQAGEERDVRERLLIRVEGHTDSQRCRGSDSCNWYISAQRAAAFRNLLADPPHCAGAEGFRVVPVGYADTRPDDGELATRRIEVRLVPDYEAIIAAASTE